MGFFYRHLEGLILAALLVFAAVFFYAGTALPEYRDLLVNISAGCISSILIIGGIEYLRKRRESQRSTHIAESVEEDIKRLSNMFVSYMASPLGSSVLNYERKPDEENEAFGERAIRLVLSDVQQRDLIRFMRDMSVSDWRGFSFNLQWVRQSLGETVQAYLAVMPPEIYGRLLKVRIAFNYISNNFFVFHDLFLKPESEWPPNKHGVERSRSAREHTMRTLNENFHEYFAAVEELFKAIDQTYN